ncbi:hypothetical protein [Scytonema sp. NUACC21]
MLWKAPTLSCLGSDFSRYLENPTSIPLTPVATTPEEQRTGSPTRREALISPPSL